jgi:hypothetical protein
VGEIRIHREDVVGFPRQRLSETGQVRRPQAQLAGAMDDVDPSLTVGRKLVGQLACAIGGVVVYHDHLKIDREIEQLVDQILDVLSLVIGWDNNCCLQVAFPF